MGACDLSTQKYVPCPCRWFKDLVQYLQERIKSIHIFARDCTCVDEEHNEHRFKQVKPTVFFSKVLENNILRVARSVGVDI
jgi:hypothetical protein